MSRTLENTTRRPAAPTYVPGELHSRHPIVLHYIAKARRQRSEALHGWLHRLFGRTRPVAGSAVANRGQAACEAS